MATAPRRSHLLWAVALLASYAALGGTAAEPKRVFLLQSFGHYFEPSSDSWESFRTELVRRSGTTVDLYEVSLLTARVDTTREDAPFVDYLLALFSEHRPDLVVPIGGPAVRFAQRQHQRLFPRVPMLFTAIDQRLVPDATLTANETVVPIKNDLPGLIENILQVLPATTTVAVVLGASPLEKFWAQELRREIQPFTNRINFVWFDKMSFEEIKQRVAALPPRSAILYGMMLVDAAGVPHTLERGLEELHAAASAPIFGVFGEHMGRGIVGGRLISHEELGRNAADVAIRILHGETPSAIKTPPLGPGTPIYDSRELRRWGINEATLPPGSIVRFREPTVWQQYKSYIIAATTILVLQATLIVALVWQRVRRRRAEHETAQHLRDLREAEQQADLAADAASLGIWARDLASDDIWANPKWRELFGFLPAEPLHVGRLLEKIHPDDRASYRAALARATQDQGVYYLEHRLNLPSGQIRWIGSQGRVEFDERRQPIRIRGASIDITLRRHAEQEMLLLRREIAHVGRVSALGQLASALAHEINQPLAAILRNAEAATLFLQNPSPDLIEVGAILEDIRQDDQRASGVIDRMRALLKREGGAMLPLELARVFRDVETLLRPDAALRHVKLVFDAPDELPLVLGDRVQLQQVLINLVMNGMDAVQSAAGDDRNVTVIAQQVDERVEVCVSDNGRGIPPERLESVFDPFFSTKAEGLGMGLAISRTIVDAHGGHLWAEPNVECGARIRFILRPTAAAD